MIRQKEILSGEAARALFRVVNHRMGSKDVLIGRTSAVRFALKHKGEYHPHPTFSGFIRLNGIEIGD